MIFNKTYLKPEVAFLLKSNAIDIKTKYLTTHTGEKIDVTTELINNYDKIELAYNPTIDEVIEFFKNKNIHIQLNKISSDNWEWIMSFKERKIYSGEIVNGGICQNIPENREYFKSEYDAFNDAIVETIIIL